MGLYKDKAYNVEEQNIIKERIPNDRLLITKDCEICQNICNRSLSRQGNIPANQHTCTNHGFSTQVLGNRIRKTCPCNEYPLKPHFYIAKLGYAGVYLFFLFLLKT